jgi:hypothetical protein
MHCPDCGKRLYGIQPLSKEEWSCINPECPANKRYACGANSEYYGTTQKIIDTQKHTT